MSYTLKDYENYIEILKDFSELDWVKNYLELKIKPNFWTIIEYGRYESYKDRSAHETRMSKMNIRILIFSIKICHEKYA